MPEVSKHTWFPEVASPAEFNRLEDTERGPLAMFSRLALRPPSLAYVQSLNAHNLRHLTGTTIFFDVDGWHYDPACSTSAKWSLRNNLSHAFPNLPGKAELLDDLCETYAQLARGLDTRTLTFNPRITLGSPAKFNEFLHVDQGIGMTKSALVYIAGRRTKLANSADIPDPNDYGECRAITPQLREQLAEPPALSIAAWRAEEKAAWHAEPYRPEGELRYAIISRVLSRNYQPAIR